MPEEHKKKSEVLDAIGRIELLSDLLPDETGQCRYPLELEVIVYGRNYDDKDVGPYMRLLTYGPEEVVYKDGEPTGNKFYLVVDGHFDVFNQTLEKKEVKVEERVSGEPFGIIALLAGIAYNATVKAPPKESAQLLEIQRPALRLLRKLSRFGEVLDEEYGLRGKNTAFEELRLKSKFTPEQENDIKLISTFKVYPKNHVLCRQGGAINQIFIIKDGWVRRSRETKKGETEDFLGGGYCFGLDEMEKNERWSYAVTTCGRSEVLEIPAEMLSLNGELIKSLYDRFSSSAPPPFLKKTNGRNPKARKMILESRKELIDTGLVDGTNLLVMDMDLCIRCGNCSKACHKIHGQTRLTRRGIHVARLKRQKPMMMIQSALMPQVCLHCKDPECLTGCPTGAINRMPEGHIDIHPKTCIGCGDCASQCPYDAISLIPREGEESVRNGNHEGMIHNLFSFDSNPIPKPVETVKNMVAVKCNLCDGTSINPEGSRTARYSCEDNCPTGALARINPREYFDEIGQIEGPLYKDKKRSICSNIHKYDCLKIITHLICIAMFLLAGALTLRGLRLYGMGEPLVWFLNMRWITGIVGTLGIIGAMVYMARRRSYLRRRGYLKSWLLAHYYLGGMAAVIIILHGGTGSGGAITGALTFFFDLVILTGLFGCSCYFFVPRFLTRIEGAPLLLDDLMMRREELQEEFKKIMASESEPLRTVVRKRIMPRLLSLRCFLRQYVKRENLDQMIEASRKRIAPNRYELLLLHLERQGMKSKYEEFKGHIESDRDSFLERIEKLDGKEKKIYVQVYDGVKADWPEQLKAVETAATLCRVNALIYLHRLLKVWLLPHVIVSSLMLIFLVAHLFQVIYFASR